MGTNCCSRRDVLKVGALSMFGLALPDLLQAKADAKADSCIIVWLDGGPSHVDSFDLKPDAPIEYRGTFKPIRTSLDGCRISEHLPKIAKQMKKMSLLRSLTSLEGNHDRGSHLYLTGWHPSPALVYPSMGSVSSKEFGVGKKGVPTYITLPQGPQFSGAGYLTAKYDPYTTQAGQGNFALGYGLTEDRLDRRKKMLKEVDDFQRVVENDPRDTFYDQAFDLITSEEAKRAFDLNREKPQLRQKYGGFTLGKSCLMARRLVEAGARFVTVRDTGWDTHNDGFKRLSEGFPGKLPGLDQAFSALIEDLESRGMLKKTLVVLMGEFGRTPKINAAGGRDHWPRVNFSLLAGGGIRAGKVVGESDARGELPKDRPIKPEELVATIYQQLGIDIDKTYTTQSGRPVKILDPTKAIPEIT